MSEIVSRRPSSRNQWNDAFWMSIRLGRSRTCFRREKLLRARGAATPLLNYEASLGNGLRMCRRTSTAGTGQLTESGQACARASPPPAQSEQYSRSGRGRGAVAVEFASWSFCAQSVTIGRPLVPSLEEVHEEVARCHGLCGGLLPGAHRGSTDRADGAGGGMTFDSAAGHVYVCDGSACETLARR